MQLLQGGPIAKRIRREVAERARALAEDGIVPTLVAVVTSADPAIRSYVQSKQRTASSVGITLVVAEPRDATQAGLETLLDQLAQDPSVHGILLESPLGPGLRFDEALEHLPPAKDVDGLTPTNLGRVAAGCEDDAILATTPLACIELAETLGPLTARRVGVVGRGRTVGRPLVSLLLNRDATPTVCHTRTADLAAALAPCDLIIVAAGRPRLVTGAHVREGHVVIDAGINVEGEHLVGDVDAEAVEARSVAALSPVPGGVGPVTTAIIFRNVLRAIDLQRGRRGRG